MIEERIRPERAVRGDRAEGCTERSVERQVTQFTGGETSVMNIPEAVQLFGEPHRPSLQLREQILQFGGVRMHIRQVRHEVGVVDVRQTDGTHVTLQESASVILHRQAVERQ